MKTKYINLIDQTFDFPQEEFTLKNGTLHYYDVDLQELINTYGTPLKFTYLPAVSNQVKLAVDLFGNAMKKVNYPGKYHFCYVAKSSHFKPVIETTLRNGAHMETSGASDIEIAMRLAAEDKLTSEKFVICNGYKPDRYLDNIIDFIKGGHTNTIPVLDNVDEFYRLKEKTDLPLNLGIRIASEEEPKFEFYTSRLGIGYKEILPFYKEVIKPDSRFSLKMLHFFINTGIRDNAYYWNELRKCLNVYVALRKVCPQLDSLNIGGGFPVKNSLNFDYDYAYMADTIIEQVKEVCEENNVPCPDIFTEFGSFTVSAAGGVIFKVLNQKKQNDKERWNMIDSSFMTTLPDSWAISKRFILLPVNRWNEDYERVFLGGITCDSDDYYNSEQHVNAIYLPKYNKDKPLYIGFFGTGAYQESLGGYGGIQHCLTPAPKMILIDKDGNGVQTHREFAPEQSANEMLKILGY